MAVKLPRVVTEEDRAVYGEILLKMVQEPGWQAFVSLLNNRKQNIGSAALDDEARMQKYWRGRRDELDEIIAEVNSLVDEALEMKDVEPEVEKAFLGRRIVVPGGEEDEDDGEDVSG